MNTLTIRNLDDALKPVCKLLLHRMAIRSKRRRALS